jgi:uncharacterized damage-inducible protein DinB
MINTLNTELWRQFGAAIDMFENAIRKCPESLWDDGQNFWYIAYHTLFWTDYYLTEESATFLPPEPFTLGELDPAGLMPENTYSKDELLNYAVLCREKARTLLGGFTDDLASNRWIDDSRNYSMLEMTFYNMRHVMHHTGQLNLMLGRIDHALPVWVSQSKNEL